jgi:hypothetical protein
MVRQAGEDNLEIRPRGTRQPCQWQAQRLLIRELHASDEKHDGFGAFQCRERLDGSANNATSGLSFSASASVNTGSSWTTTTRAGIGLSPRLPDAEQEIPGL